MYQKYSDIMCSAEDRRDLYSFAKRIILSTRPHIRLYAVHQETMALVLTGVNKHLSERNTSEMHSISERRTKQLRKIEKPSFNKNDVIKILKQFGHNLEFTLHSDAYNCESQPKFTSAKHSTPNTTNVSVQKREMNMSVHGLKKKIVDSGFFSQEESAFQRAFCDDLKKAKNAIVERVKRAAVNHFQSSNKTISKCDKVDMYSVIGCSRTTLLDSTVNSDDVSMHQVDVSLPELEWQDTFGRPSEPIRNNHSFSHARSSLPINARQNIQTIFNNCEETTFPSSSTSSTTTSRTTSESSSTCSESTRPKKTSKSSTYVLKIILNIPSEGKPTAKTTIKSLSSKPRRPPTQKKTTKCLCFKTLAEFKKTALTLLKQSMKDQVSLKAQLMKVQQELHILSENRSEGEQNYHMCVCLEKDDAEDIRLSKLSSTFSLVNGALEDCSSTENELLDIKRNLDLLASRFMDVHLTDSICI